MATTKDGLLRIKIIDELLSNTSSGYTTNELLNEVNNKLKSKEKDSITLRTVQRDLNDLETIYEDIAKKRGILAKGGVPDYEKVYSIIKLHLRLFHFAPKFKIVILKSIF